MLKFNKLLLVAMFMLLVNNIFADDFKLAYVNLDRIFKTSQVAIQIKATLKKHFDPMNNKVRGLQSNILDDQKQIQVYAKQYSSIDQVPVSSRKIVDNLEAKLEKDQLAFRGQYEVLQQQLNAAQNYAAGLVLTETTQILKGLSAKNGYDLVLTSNQLVYAKPKYDLTDQVLSSIDNMSTKPLLNKLNSMLANIDKNVPSLANK